MPDVSILTSSAYTDNRTKEERSGALVEYDIDEKGSIYGDDKKDGVQTDIRAVGEHEVAWAGGVELLEAAGFVPSLWLVSYRVRPLAPPL